MLKTYKIPEREPDYFLYITHEHPIQVWIKPEANEVAFVARCVLKDTREIVVASQEDFQNIDEYIKFSIIKKIFDEFVN